MIKFRDDVRNVYETAKSNRCHFREETLFELILGLNRADPVLLALSTGPDDAKSGARCGYDKPLEKLADPRRFERPASAFGAI
jgi:hypothetical protein